MTNAKKAPLELTILMPCLNEAETLKPCIQKALKFLRQSKIRGEVLIADNGSTDGSVPLARSLGARVVSIREKGYGHALRGGIAAARGKYVIMGDSDDSYDFSRLGSFMQKLRKGNALVMGCRMPWGGGRILPGAMPWKHFWIGNPSLTFLGKLFFRSPINDFHCGLRGFSRAEFRALNLNTTGMEFASEMVIKAALMKLPVAEVPITLHPDGRSRPPHLRSWRDGWRHLRFMLLLAPKWLFLVPGISLVLLGLISQSIGILGPLKVGPPVFSVGTQILGMLAMLMGLLVCMQAIQARVFCEKENLLPPSKLLATLFRFFSLEKGLALAAFLGLVSLIPFSLSLWDWVNSGFANINIQTNLQRLILFCALFGSSVIVASGSFALSVLGLQVAKIPR